MSAASPGVVAVFFRNDHYPSEEAYLYAIADAMRHEYEAVAKAGFVLQIDCPDLAMGKHIKYHDVDLEDLPQGRRAQHRGDEPRDREHPGRAAAHACVLGQLRRPASLRRAARRRDRSRVQGAPSCDLVRGREPAPRARVDAVRDGEAAGRQGADPRRDRVEVELHRASGADRAAHRPLREAGRARERHGAAATAATAPGSGRRRSIPTWCGPSSPRSPRARGSRRRSSGSNARPSSSRSVATASAARRMARPLRALRHGFETRARSAPQHEVRSQLFVNVSE